MSTITNYAQLIFLRFRESFEIQRKFDIFDIQRKYALSIYQSIMCLYTLDLNTLQYLPK